MKFPIDFEVDFEFMARPRKNRPSSNSRRFTLTERNTVGLERSKQVALRRLISKLRSLQEELHAVWRNLSSVRAEEAALLKQVSYYSKVFEAFMRSQARQPRHVKEALRNAILDELYRCSKSDSL